MKPRTAAVLAAFLSLAFWPGNAIAQANCNTREAVERILRDKYQEQVVAIGITGQGHRMEVFASDDGATWSVVVTTPRGMACLAASGRNWRSQKPDDRGQKSDKGRGQDDQG